CSSGSGATPSTRERMSWMCTWPGCGRRWERRRSKRCAVSGIASLGRRYWQEIGLGLFWLANFVVLWHLTSWTTVPFHFIWVSLTIFYGFRVWGLRPTFFVLAIVCVLTGMGLVHAAESHGGPGIDELTEIPLMSAMFLAMVWHAKRREDALE